MGEFVASEQRAAEESIKNKLSKDVQKVIDVTFANILGISRRIEVQGKGIDLSREEYKLYKKIIAEKIEEQIKPLILFPSPELIDEAISEAKKLAVADMTIKLLEK